MLLIAIGSAPPLPLPTPSLPAKLSLFLMQPNFNAVMRSTMYYIVLVYLNEIQVTKILRQPNMHQNFQHLLTYFVIYVTVPGKRAQVAHFFFN